MDGLIKQIAESLGLKHEHRSKYHLAMAAAAACWRVAQFPMGCYLVPAFREFLEASPDLCPRMVELDNSIRVGDFVGAADVIEYKLPGPDGGQSS